MKYITRITRYTITPEDDPIFAEMATTVQIEDEAAGEYVSIEQISDNAEIGKVRIDPNEWQAIACAVADLFAEIKKHEKHKP